MSLAFNTAVEFTLKWEGGFSDDPNDPGGKTRWGIASRAHPDVNLETLTRQDAIEIYRREYWVAAHCEDYSTPLAVALFDTAVNVGVTRARGWLRDTDRGWSGLLLARLGHYSDLCDKAPELRTYLRGWVRRTVELGRLCRQLEA